MESSWARSISWVLDAERGSKLTLEEHNAYRDAHFDPKLERREDASRHEIETIYRISYWQPFAQVLPTGLDFFFFDTAVVHGVPDAIKMMQHALGVEADGHIGVVTTQAFVQAIRDNKIPDMLDRYARVRPPTDRSAKALKYAKDLLR